MIFYFKDECYVFIREKHYKGFVFYEKPGKQLFGAKEKIFSVSTVRLVSYVDRFRKDKNIIS